MTHGELIGLLLTAHAGILGVALVLFYTYSDRTDGFAGSLKGVSTVLAEMAPPHGGRTWRPARSHLREPWVGPLTRAWPRW